MTSMLVLPNISLVAMGSKDINGMANALEISSEEIKFGEVKLISHKCPRFSRNSNIKFDYIKPINSIDDWNYQIIYSLYKHIETEFALLVHGDGYVIRPDLWKDEFLKYDYIGAPWPLPRDNYSYRTESGRIVRVGNSVSIRSKRLMQRVAKFKWKSYFGNTNEDGFISVHHRDELESEGYKFAPLELAVHFSKEHEIPENKGIDSFAFHSL